MICIGWAGFPQYGARCVKALVDSTDEEVVVVATPPRVPIKGMEKVCGCRVIWVPDNDPQSLRELLGGPLPRLMTVSGWFLENYNRYAREVRQNGGRVIACSDDNFKGYGLKECLKAFRFRVRVRPHFDAFWVPGMSGVKLMSFYGVPRSRIITNLYTADARLFTNGAPLAERAKKIIYVGQFIERKNVRRLVQAFQQANVPGWTLEMYGSGPLKDELGKMADNSTVSLKPQPKILIHQFLQPEELAAKYREARIFCLPSLEEHWGLVVHEAALSGCELLLSDRVGAADDLLGTANGVLFDPHSVESMARALKKAMEMTDGELRAAQEESLRLAKTVSIERFVEGIVGTVRSEE